MEACGRYDQDMLGDGRCGFYGIFANLHLEYRGTTLAHESQGGNRNIHEKVKKQIEKLKAQAGLRRWSRGRVGNYCLDSDMFPAIAGHYGRAVVSFGVGLNGRHGLGGTYVDIAIPGLSSAISIADLDASFFKRAAELANFNGHDLEIIGRYFRPYNLNGRSTIAEVATRLLRDQTTIGLLHHGSHFHAMLPKKPAWN
jgi:hypothetical protein